VLAAVVAVRAPAVRRGHGRPPAPVARAAVGLADRS
jgi:hypothetical protein